MTSKMLMFNDKLKISNTVIRLWPAFCLLPSATSSSCFNDQSDKIFLRDCDTKEQINGNMDGGYVSAPCSKNFRRPEVGLESTGRNQEILRQGVHLLHQLSDSANMDVEQQISEIKETLAKIEQIPVLLVTNSKNHAIKNSWKFAKTPKWKRFIAKLLPDALIDRFRKETLR